MSGPSKTKQATEEYVYRIVGNSESRLEERIGTVESRLESKIDNLEQVQNRRFDTVMVTLDKILVMFRKFDDEQTVSNHQIRRNTDRIEKLEQKILPS